MITEKELQVLEFDRILERLGAYAASHDGKALALAVRPAESLAEAQRQMQRTSDARELTVRFGFPAFSQMDNPVAALRRAQLGGVLSLRELLDIAEILRTLRSLQEWKRQSDEKTTSLDGLFSCLYADRPLENRLTQSIVSEDELDDNASAELSDIRRKIRAASLRVRERLDDMVRSATYQKYLQEAIVTMRDGRFVVPVRAEFKNEIKGLVHDTSASGATFFIEPMHVVEANNEIRLLQAKEEQEIRRILAELSALAAQAADPLEAGYRAAVELDLYFAKARLADAMRAAAPAMQEEAETRLMQARHPLLNPDAAVPIDIAVGGEYDTLIITGPNTGGKTVALKTLGLLTLMAMSGLMIPASHGSAVSFYDNVLADIGDEQSIEQSLSTFSAHMTNIISILKKADWRSLVLLDELGAGTDPVEGAALGIAIVQSLREKGARVAATTHYPEIKIYALDTDGVENASCEFDVASLRPTYRLLTGIPGRSNAFLISERLGLPQAVIERAKALVSGENTRFEDVVSELEATRQSLELERGEAKRLRDEAESLREQARERMDRLEQSADKEMEKARQQARRIVEETRALSEMLFEELDAIKKEKDSERFSQLLAGAKSEYKSSMNELEQMANPVTAREDGYVLPRPLEKGDVVYVRTLGKEGLVLKKPTGNQVLVQAGILKTSVPVADVVLGNKPREKSSQKESRAKRGSVSAQIQSRAFRDIKTELDLRGQDAEQAVMELDAFLDQAMLSGIKTVRIIHGKGTGVLRNAVAQRLRGNKNIDSFRLGRYGEGENGVTIAEFK